MFKPARKRACVLVLLALVSIAGMFIASNEPVMAPLRGSMIESVLHALHHENAIVFNLSVGYLVSMMFWLMMVYLPELGRRRLLRANLRRRYRQFRKDTIRILLRAAIGTHDAKLPEALCDHLAFRQFFEAHDGPRWQDVHRSLEGEPGALRLEDLLLELELFSAEVGYVLNNVDIADPQPHAFFKRLSENIYRRKSADRFANDHIDSLCNFLWMIHARRDVFGEHLERDPIEHMIAAL